MRSLAPAAVALALLASCSAPPAPGAAAPQAANPKMVAHPGAPTIPGSWVVVLSDGTPAADVDRIAAELAARHHGRVGFVYRDAFPGFSVRASPADADALSRDPRVKMVEPDLRMRPRAPVSPIVQPPSQGVDRVDQQRLPLSCTYRFRNLGAGVHVYVLDQDVFLPHKQFGNDAAARQVDRLRFPMQPADCLVGDDDDLNRGQCKDHGTKVASIAAGSTVSPAPAVNLHAVCVDFCNRSLTTPPPDDMGASLVVAGIEAVIADVKRRALTSAVANFSIGFDGVIATAVEMATASLLAANVTCVIATSDVVGADNCAETFGHVDGCIRVGATNTGVVGGVLRDTSTRSTGRCIDLYAPGELALAALAPGPGSTATDLMVQFGGTSGSAPLVAGVAALYLEKHPGAGPAEVKRALLAAATPKQIYQPQTGALLPTANLLAYSYFNRGLGTIAATPACLGFDLSAGSTAPKRLSASVTGSLDAGGDPTEVGVSTNLACLGLTPPPGQCNPLPVIQTPGAITVDASRCTPAPGDSQMGAVTIAADNLSKPIPVRVRVGARPTFAGSLLGNGGFEGGAAPWVFEPETQYRNGNLCNARTGAGFAELAPVSAGGAVYQTVTIPCDAQPKLTFGLDVKTTLVTTTASDKLRVDVTDAAGAVLLNLATFSNLDQGADYQTRGPFDLSRFACKKVRVRFRGVRGALTDGATTFRVDDVFLGGMGPPPMTSLSVTPASLTFTAPMNGPNPGPQSLSVTSTPSGLAFTARADRSFLMLSATQGTTPAPPLLVSVDVAGLAAGTYTGNVIIESPNVASRTVAVTLTVTQPSGLTVMPASLSFAATQGGPNPAGKSLTVTSNPSRPFTVTSSAAFLKVAPASAGTPASVTASVDIAGLAPATYNAQLTFASSGVPSVNVPVQLVVMASGGGGPTGPNAVVNGGFEAGIAPWLFLTGAQLASDGLAHAGAAYASLDYNFGAAPLIKQQLTVPANGKLTFFLNVTSPLGGVGAVDNLRVYLSDPDFAITDIAAFSNLDKGAPGAYVQRGPYDLSAFGGKTITLFFRATSSGQFGIGSSVFRIDDVVVASP